MCTNYGLPKRNGGEGGDGGGRPGDLLNPDDTHLVPLSNSEIDLMTKTLIRYSFLVLVEF